MFQRILVPVDGSLPAEQSLPWAARVARATHAGLMLLRVVTSPSESALYEAEENATARDELDARQVQAMSYLQELAQRQEFAGLDVVPLVSSGPLAADEILAAARTHGADLIMLSTHLHTDRTRWLQASVAQNVIRLADAPVLVVHEQPLTPAGVGAAPQLPDSVRVLVTLDGSRCAEGVLNPVVDLAQAMTEGERPQLHLLRVVEPTSTAGGGTSSAAERIHQASENAADMEEAGTYLAGIAARMREGPDAARIEITWSVASSFDPVEVILRETGEGTAADGEERAATLQTTPACNLLAMTTHGAGGIRSWSLGSITDRVLHASATPLLIARPLGS